MKDTMLILHMLGLSMGIGTSFAFMFLGIAAKKMEKEKAVQFKLDTFPVSRMGHIGLTLLVISGLYLITPYWSSLGSMPLLITKLILVVVLGALIGIIGARGKKARAGNPETYFGQIEQLGKITMLTGLAIVILAVLSFH